MPDSSHLQTLFSVIDEGFCLCEMIHDAAGRPVDYRFLQVNALFEDMTGLADATGRTAMELVPGLEYSWVETYARVAAGEAMRFQSGSETMGRVFDVFATPVRPQGRFALVFRDITAQRRAEAEREAARERAERLLAELNHRVMNTLAMIASIVRMERRALDGDDPAAAPIDRLQARLTAATELFRALNSAAAGDQVEARPFLPRVAEAVSQAMADDARITVTAEVADLALPARQAAPLGLLANELMTNALKYAFPGGRAGRIALHLRPLAGQRLELVVADDGVGISGKARGADGTELPGSGIGSTLIAAFADQLEAEMRRETGPGGTRVTVIFPDLSPETALAESAAAAAS